MQRLGRTHIGIYTVLNESFPPQPPPSPLEYIQYSRGHRWLLCRKIFYSKLRSTPKREIFSQDKIKFHGKADACRGILLQYLGKKIRFGAYKSLCEAALTPLLFYKNATSCSTRNTAALLASATTIKLLFLNASTTPIRSPAAPLIM